MKTAAFFCLLSLASVGVAKNVSVQRARDSDFDTDDDFDYKSYYKDSDLNMKGGVRKSFALEAALQNVNYNSICSPLSALLPLAKLALGAAGHTREELLRALGYSKRSKMKNKLKRLIKELSYLSGAVLSVASRIYVSKDVKIRSAFDEDSRNIFKSSVERIDFSSPSRASDTINDWVRRNTNGLIDNLVSPTALMDETLMVIVNAVYFLGKWQKPFERVFVSKFHSPRGEKSCTMMVISERFKYVKSNALKAEIVEIPYKESDASFILILPNEGNSLSNMLNKLKKVPLLLEEALAQMKHTNVRLTMPKFKVVSSWNLKDLLKKIGVNSIFQRHTADLSKMVKYDDGQKDVYVGHAIQKTIIEVDDRGTEGGAGSGFVIIPVKLIVGQVQFNANRPFLFFVKVSKQQLFAGTCVNP